MLLSNIIYDIKFYYIEKSEIDDVVEIINLFLKGDFIDYVIVNKNNLNL